jgi:hypothetical protein
VSQFEQDQADALEQTLTEQERTLLDWLAEALAKRRLTSAALFLLESLKPMGFLGSQMMLMMRPLLALVWPKMGPTNGLGATEQGFEARPDPATWDRVQNLLERRGAVELLLRRLEARA